MPNDRDMRSPTRWMSRSTCTVDGDPEQGLKRGDCKQGNLRGKPPAEYNQQAPELLFHEPVIFKEGEDVKDDEDEEVFFLVRSYLSFPSSHHPVPTRECAISILQDKRLKIVLTFKKYVQESQIKSTLQLASSICSEYAHPSYKLSRDKYHSNQAPTLFWFHYIARLLFFSQRAPNSLIFWLNQPTWRVPQDARHYWCSMNLSGTRRDGTGLAARTRDGRGGADAGGAQGRAKQAQNGAGLGFDEPILRFMWAVCLPRTARSLRRALFQSLEPIGQRVGDDDDSQCYLSLETAPSTSKDAAPRPSFAEICHLYYDLDNAPRDPLKLWAEGSTLAVKTYEGGCFNLFLLFNIYLLFSSCEKTPAPAFPSPPDFVVARAPLFLRVLVVHLPRSGLGSLPNSMSSPNSAKRNHSALLPCLGQRGICGDCRAGDRTSSSFVLNQIRVKNVADTDMFATNTLVVLEPARSAVSQRRFVFHTAPSFLVFIHSACNSGSICTSVSASVKLCRYILLSGSTDTRSKFTAGRMGTNLASAADRRPVGVGLGSGYTVSSHLAPRSHTEFCTSGDLSTTGLATLHGGGSYYWAQNGHV
ncbi:hypothetical protein B0H14DRAFT_3695467 [Mycena olivaceomarginata]|nr:hypothetical protein B0H14DRAFT_3695467 [Mycena olivaceomarginata]